MRRQLFCVDQGGFDRFVDPLVYAPGDNEWTDCHRPNNGSYNPPERLARVREVLFPRPGKTLDQPSIKVASQANEGFVENVSYSRANVEFATVHLVGINNSLAPWTGGTIPIKEQFDEVDNRTKADIELIDQVFDRATDSTSEP